MKKHLYDIFADKWLKDCDSVWLYSDPHFSDLESYKLRFPTTFQEGTEFMHSSLVEICDNEQIKKINAKCGKNACLIILGDIGNVECIKKLKAKYKILIMGNHDKGASNYEKEVYHDIKWDSEFSEGFIPERNGYKLVESTPAGDVYDKITTNSLFDEVYEGPLMINDRLILSHEPITGYGNYLFNIHGHVHNKEYKGDTTHLNVCAEAVDYTPVNFLKLLRSGLLKNIDNIHRKTIDYATERKRHHEER